ncbi:MAG: hypothetical protein R3C03_08565 [Pirellulaceae bacterium]
MKDLFAGIFTLVTLCWSTSFGQSLPPAGITDLPGGLRNNDEAILVDDVLRKRVQDVLDEEVEQVEFPDWLDLNDIDRRRHMSVNMHSVDGNAKYVMLEGDQFGFNYRRLTVSMSSPDSPLEVKVERFFERNEAAEFADILPAFSEYIESFPERQGDIDIGLTFSAGKTFQFESVADLEARAKSLYVHLTPIFKQSSIQMRQQQLMDDIRREKREDANIRIQAMREAQQRQLEEQQKRDQENAEKDDD